MFRPRGRINPASWVMVPAAAMLDITLGLTWLNQSDKVHGSTLDGLRHHGLDPHMVGGTLIVLGILAFIGMAIGYLWMPAVPIGGAAAVFFTLTWIASNPGPTQSAGGVPVWAYIGIAHLCSCLSLAMSEPGEIR